MSIRKKPDGRWLAVVDVGRDIDGKRIQKTKTCKTKHEAEKFIHDWENRKGSYTDYTLNTFFEEYYLPYAEMRVRPYTLERYKENYRKLIQPHLGRMKVADIKALEVQRLIDRCKTYGAMRNTYTTMRQILRRACAWGLIDRVATDGCTLPKHTRSEIVVIEGSQFVDYLKAVQTYEPAILPMVCVGMMGARRSECCGLRWEDFSFGDVVSVRISRSVSYVGHMRVVSDTKTEHSTRTIIFPEWLGSILRECRGTGDIWLGHPDTYTSAWARALKKASLPHIRLKDLRHSVGTTLISAGLSLYDVQQLLGHDLPTTTAKFYIQKNDASIIRAASMMEEIVNPKGES